MADGTTKPIADIQVGDMVVATDPETGERGARRVTDTIVGDGIKDLVDVEIDGHVITATNRHPFWVNDQGRWVDAEDLEAGDVLLLADGDTATVDAVSERTEVRRVHNLTVDGIHTYYVLAGGDAVLVHNCAKPTWPSTADKMDDFLGVPGTRVPDGPMTPGRGKVTWQPSDHIRITFEQHPYHPNAPAWHRGPHWHLDTPGATHQRWLPGDEIPGF